MPGTRLAHHAAKPRSAHRIPTSDSRHPLTASARAASGHTTSEAGHDDSVTTGAMATTAEPRWRQMGGVERFTKVNSAPMTTSAEPKETAGGIGMATAVAAPSASTVAVAPIRCWPTSS